VSAPQLYTELAPWWPLLSPPGEYGEEAADLLSRLDQGGTDRPTLLELGAGGGSLASHLKHRYRMTLTDLAPGMLAVSRALNPECEHQVGDMRLLELGRTFDVVLIHDAIMYATTAADVRAVLRTAALHCRRGGTLVLLPDFTRESFAPGTEHGGYDAPDGRGLRYLEWVWDPDPADDTFLTDYAFMLRTRHGTVSVVHDRHVEGLFARQRWLAWIAEAGFDVRSEIDRWGREIFLGVRQ
jgi:trans-aconitate methyltransferase